MALYVSDGDIYAGWKSSGRWFALSGVFALVIALLCFSLIHAPGHATLSPSDQIFAAAGEWVGGCFFWLMLLVAAGSITISRQQRGDVLVSPDGIRRILTSNRREFLPLDQILGLSARMAGGVTLVARKPLPNMIVPRSLVGYRGCIAEIKALGIPVLPIGYEGERSKQTWPERILTILSASGAGTFFSRHAEPLSRHIGGIVALVLLVTVLWLEQRRTLRRKIWTSAIFLALALFFLLQRW